MPNPDLLIRHGSLVLIVAWLLLGGAGLPLPEDPALVAAGVLAHRGVVPLAVATGVVLVAVLAGDAALFFGARHLGPAAFELPRLRRVLTPERRARIDAAFRRHGGKVVFVTRHIAGLRAAAFALAGIHRMSPRRFLAWDALAACLSVPLAVGAGYAGSHALESLRGGVALGLVAAVAAIAAIARRACTRRRADLP